MLKNIDTNNRDIWAGPTEAARVTSVPARTVRNWMDSKAIAVNEHGEVSIIEIFRRDLARLDAQLEKLQDKGPQHRLTIAQCRKTEAEASLREWELSQESSKLIELSEAREDWDNARRMAKETFADLPHALAKAIAKEQSPRVIQAMLMDEIDRRLYHLSHALAAQGDEDE